MNNFNGLSPVSDVRVFHNYHKVTNVVNVGSKVFTAAKKLLCGNFVLIVKKTRLEKWKSLN